MTTEREIESFIDTAHQTGNPLFSVWYSVCQANGDNAYYTKMKGIDVPSAPWRQYQGDFAAVPRAVTEAFVRALVGAGLVIGVSHSVKIGWDWGTQQWLRADMPHSAGWVEPRLLALLGRDLGRSAALDRERLYCLRFVGDKCISCEVAST
jgi:hypothetical protein